MDDFRLSVDAEEFQQLENVIDSYEPMQYFGADAKGLKNQIVTFFQVINILKLFNNDNGFKIRGI